MSRMSRTSVAPLVAPLSEKEQLSFAQRVICSAAAGHLLAWLGPYAPEEVAQWIREGRDWSTELPDDLPLPKLPIVRPVLLRALQDMDERTWGHILELMAAGAPEMCRREAERTGNPEHMAEAPRIAERLQTIAAMLADKRAWPWYCRTMSRLRDRIVARLEGSA